MVLHIFPQLYKTSRNKTLIWKIQVDENDSGYGIITVNFGQETGKIQEKITVIRAGKAKRTPYEQAYQRAERKWKDHKDKHGYSQTRTNAAKITIFPMLAYDFRKYGHKIKYPALVQRKLDGVRCIAFRGPNSKIELRTRSMKLITSMPHFNRRLKRVIPRKSRIYIDGELYNHNLPLQTINGYVNKKTVSDVNRKFIRKNIEYHIFDFFDLDALNLPFSERYERLQSLGLGKLKKIHLVKAETVASAKGVERLNTKYFAEGYEGIMVRNVDAPYKLSSGRSGRSSDLQKYKTYEIERYQIVNILECPRRPDTIILRLKLITGREFNVNGSGKFSYQREVLRNKEKYIGKFVRIRYFGKTEDDVPKFGKTILDKSGHLILLDA